MVETAGALDLPIASIQKEPIGVGVGLLMMGGIDAGSDWTTLLGGFLVAGAACVVSSIDFRSMAMTRSHSSTAVSSTRPCPPGCAGWRRS